MRRFVQQNLSRSLLNLRVEFDNLIISANVISQRPRRWKRYGVQESHDKTYIIDNRAILLRAIIARAV